MGEFRRIVIDSRYRTSDSLSNADFYVELPYAVNVPTGSLAYIDNISLSHSWPTIRQDVNDRLYVQELPAVIRGDYRQDRPVSSWILQCTDITN